MVTEGVKWLWWVVVGRGDLYWVVLGRVGSCWVEVWSWLVVGCVRWSWFVGGKWWWLVAMGVVDGCRWCYVMVGGIWGRVGTHGIVKLGDA